MLEDLSRRGLIMIDGAHYQLSGSLVQALEGRWDAGAISLDHARRLWAAFSLVVQILLDHGPHLLDVFVPGEALLSRSTGPAGSSSPQAAASVASRTRGPTLRTIHLSDTRPISLLAAPRVAGALVVVSDLHVTGMLGEFKALAMALTWFRCLPERSG